MAAELNKQMTPEGSDTPSSQKYHPDYHYELMLQSCERLFDNEIEQSAFEEQMRSTFGTKVSMIYSQPSEIFSEHFDRRHTGYSQ